MNSYSANSENVRTMILNTSILQIDPEYQRTWNRHRSVEIAKGFSMQKFDPPKVSHRDGKYYIFDGQHTEQAVILLNGGKNCDIECKVYDGMTKEDEAYWFAHQYDNKKKPTSFDNYMASLVAKEPTAVNVDRIMKSFGIKIVRTALNTHSCAAPETLVSIYEKYGEARFTSLMSIIVRTWDGEAESFQKRFLNSFAKFYDKYCGNPNFSYEAFIKRLQKYSAVHIMSEARKFSNFYSGFEATVVELYNKNCHIRLN